MRFFNSQGTMVKIRRMEKTDAAPVSGLLQQLGYSVSIEEVDQRFSACNIRVDHAFFAAELDSGEIAGFIHARQDVCIHKGPSIEVSALVVSENSRSNGVGHMLMVRVEEWSANTDSERTWLRTNIKRDRAHVFYRRLGYEQISTSLQFSKNARALKSL